VLYVHTPPDFLVFSGVVAKVLNRRIVLDVHDRSPLMFKERFGGRAIGRLATSLLEVVESLACRFADEVVTVHEPYRDELARHGNTTPISVVMNSPPEDLLKAATEQRELRGLDERAGFVVGYHGTITAWYGVSLLVEALARLNAIDGQWQAVILGEGDALEDSRRRATELQVADRIRFSGGFVPIGEALSQMARVSCGVVPNLPSALNDLTLSTKLLEYVAMGVPAVVARLRTLAHHFSDDEVTFFEPGNAQAAAEALDWVRTHPNEAQAKAEAAQARYRAYAWPTSRDRFLGVLEGQLRGKGGRVSLGVARRSGARLRDEQGMRTEERVGS
jgi:glycosyltransferase involved in cell wall biosynthesis